MNFYYGNYKFNINIEFDNSKNVINLSEIPTKKLCYYLKGKNSEVIGRGLSATVYKVDNIVDNIVIKEIYLNDVFTSSRKINELMINYIISSDEELKKYSVPFHSYDVCSFKHRGKKYNSLLLEFDYVGYNLYDRLDELSSEQLYFVIMEVSKIMKLFNSRGITHNDLHPGNIFINIESDNGIPDFGIRIGDWGKGHLSGDVPIYENLNKLFFPSLISDLKFKYYLKNNTMEDAILYLKDKGLYGKYLSDVKKEIEYQRKNFQYKPSSFLKNIEGDIYTQFLKKTLSKDIYLIKSSGIPEDIMLLMDTIR